MSHCLDRLLVKYSCEIEPLLQDYAPNMFGGYDVRCAGSLECDLSNSFNAVAVCVIGNNEWGSSITLRHITPSKTPLDE